jgi:hypothetical protein
MRQKTTWAEYLKTLSVDQLTKLQSTWKHGVARKGRTIHWHKLVWNKKYHVYFNVSACGKTLEDVNNTHGFNATACAKCLRVVRG